MVALYAPSSKRDLRIWDDRVLQDTKHAHCSRHLRCFLLRSRRQNKHEATEQATKLCKLCKYTIRLTPTHTTSFNSLYRVCSTARPNGPSQYASSSPCSLCREPELLWILSASTSTTESRSRTDRSTIDLQRFMALLTPTSTMRAWFCCLWDVQIYVVYLGHLPSSDNPSEPESLSTAVEATHHELLSKVLDDRRSSILSLQLTWSYGISE